MDGISNTPSVIQVLSARLLERPTRVLPDHVLLEALGSPEPETQHGPTLAQHAEGHDGPSSHDAPSHGAHVDVRA